MEKIRSDERRVCGDAPREMEMGILLVSFGLGFLAGAVAMLLTTPEPGPKVRTRLKRGIKTVRQELDDIVGDGREAWSQVSNEAREAVKRTTTKVKHAAQVTKEALAESEPEHLNTP